MTAYADLDTSIIDELPPCRTPVTTVAIPDTRRSDIIDRVRNACTHEGRRAYWVCTLIEESDLLKPVRRKPPKSSNWRCRSSISASSTGG